jgi:hypothetical protein
MDWRSGSSGRELVLPCEALSSNPSPTPPAALSLDMREQIAVSGNPRWLRTAGGLPTTEALSPPVTRNGRCPEPQDSGSEGRKIRSPERFSGAWGGVGSVSGVGTEAQDPCRPPCETKRAQVAM